MKKLLLIVGIIIIAAGAVLLLFAALNLFGYYRVLDGSAELYAKLHLRAIVFFVIGALFAAIGAACIIIKNRI